MAQNIKYNQIATNTSTILGRTAAGTGDVQALTGTQVTGILDVFTSASKGLVPLSGGGTTTFLRADGTWATITQPVWGNITGTLANQIDLQNALNAKSNLTGGNIFTGTQQFANVGVGAAADANYPLLVRNTSTGYGLNINTTSPTVSNPNLNITNGTNNGVFYVDTAVNVGSWSNVDVVFVRAQVEGFRLTNKGVSVTGSVTSSNIVTVAYASTANFACVATTTTLTASAVGVTLVDGQTLAVNDRVLLKDQSAPEQNGVYKVTTVGTASVKTVFTRVSELNTWANIITSVEVTVTGGSSNTNGVWLCTTTGAGGTLGTTAINFRALSMQTVIPNTTGLKITSASSTLDFYAGDGTTWNGGVSGSAGSLTLTGGTGGLLIDTSSGSLTLRSAGTAVATLTSTGLSVSKLLTTTASTTTTAGITLPHGTAPTTPTNGNIWTTTGGFFAQINGSTASFTGTNTGDQTSVTGSAGSVANSATFNSAGTGAAPGTTFNGSSAVTISYNSIGALPTTGGVLTGRVTTSAPTTNAGFNLTPGTAPGSPSNGDLWATSLLLQACINGVTKTVAFTDSALTGNTSGSAGSVSGTNVITNANLRTSTASSVVGNAGGSNGNVADIVSSADGQVLRRATGSLGWGSIDLSLAATVGTTRLALANLAQPAANTILGNNTGVAANVIGLTGTQVTALLDTFTSALKGLVPGSGGGTTTFLRADGSWATPTANTTNPITFNNAGTGAISGSTFNGSAAVTISYNSIGAAPLASPTFTGKVTTAASATGGAGFNLPAGAAPTAPANGDLWTTSTNMLVQIGGASRTVAFTDSALTGNTSGSAGSVSGANVITNANLRQSAGASVIGNVGTSTANVADITAAADYNILRRSPGGSLAFGSIDLSQAGAVGTSRLAYANIAQPAANTILGNNTGSTANITNLTGTQVTAMLDSFNTTTKGLVPAPASALGRYLDDSGAWSLPGTKVAATRAALAGMVTTSPVYLTESGREGMFVWDSSNLSTFVTADTAQGLFVPPTGTPTGASGAWRRKFVGDAEASWFGFLADDNGGASTDNLAALNAALAALKAIRTTGGSVITYGVGASPGLHITGAGYVSGLITVTHGIRIYGNTGNATTGTQLRWPAGTGGFLFDVGSAGSIIEKMTLLGGWTTSLNEGEFHAVQNYQNLVRRDLFLTNWQGDGIYDQNDAASTGGVHNSNSDEITRVNVQNSRRGLYTQGGDVNAKEIRSLNCISNRWAAIHESGFLGNEYFACTTESNGFYPGWTTGAANRPASYVRDTVNGRVWACVGGQETWCSTNAPPSSATATYNQGWALHPGWAPSATVNAYLSSGIPDWVSGITVRAGGGVIHTGDSNRSAFFGIYSESNQMNQFDTNCGGIYGPDLDYAISVNRSAGSYIGNSPPVYRGGSIAGNLQLGGQVVGFGNSNAFGPQTGVMSDNAMYLNATNYYNSLIFQSSGIGGPGVFANNGSITAGLGNFIIGNTGVNTIFLRMANGSDTATLTNSAFNVFKVLNTVAPTTASAGLNLPHGTAPTAPNNGDVWTTTAGGFQRINGATRQLAYLDSNLFTGDQTITGITIAKAPDTSTPARINFQNSTGSVTAKFEALDAFGNFKYFADQHSFKNLAGTSEYMYADNTTVVFRIGNTIKASLITDAFNFSIPIAITSGGLTASSQIVAGASTTTAASFRAPHGTAPTTPNNGDMWTTTAGLFVQINGATVGPLGTGGSGGAGTTTNALTMDNSGSGAASGTTFNGSAAQTISYNTIGAQPLNSNLTAYAGANWAAGVQIAALTAANTVTLKTVGNATGNILDKAAGDSLYQPVGTYATGGGTATGTNTGDQTITLTGDVTGSGTGSFAATIGANKVTFAKLVAATQAAFVGATVAGNFGELTPTAATAALNALVGATGAVAGTKGLVPAPAATDNVKFLTGAATWSTVPTTAITGLATIATSGSGADLTANSVTLAKLATQATATVLGNVSGSTAAPSALTATQLTTLVNSFTSALSGAAPASGGGTVNYLRADGTWAAPAGNGTTTNVLTINNGGAGAASGSTFNGSSAVTLSYNSIGAAPTASPTFTGTPLAPTATADVSSTQIATTAYVQTALGLVAKAVTGGTLTLTNAEAGASTIVLTGTLTSNLTVNFGSGTSAFFNRDYTVYNGTTGAFTVTLQACVTTPGVTLTVAQGFSTEIFTNVAGVFLAGNDTSQFPSFTSTMKGIVPASGGGTTNFLRADGSWAGTGTVTSVSVTTANGVSGSVATSTTTPAITLTLGAITPTSVAASGNITAANKVDGWPFNVTGKTLASERYLLGIAQYALTVSGTNSAAKALVAATASTVFTIKKGTVASPTTIGTFTFAAAGTTATVSISAGSVSSGDVVWIEAPATPDATLQDIAFVVRS